MDGTVVHGSIQPGFREYLELMHRWWNAGLIDPDFVTRTHADYVSMVGNGDFLAFGMAYGDVGPMNMVGRAQEPRFQLVPAVTPSSRPGQTTRLGQDDSHVRTARAHVTSRVRDEGLQEPIMRWMDYWYSQDGGDLASYGIEGHAFQWNDDGTFEFIHPTILEPGADFWTLFGRFKMHEWIYLRDSTAYDMEPEVWECIELWSSQDLSWVFPDNIMLTPDESSVTARIMTDVNTHILEQTAAFIMGHRNIAEFDAFVSELESMGIREAEDIHQAALTRYLAR
jgi:putative aldouronate transport system substrate-binding protein